MNESVSGDDNAQIKAQFEALRARIDVAEARAAKAEALNTDEETARAEARAAKAEAEALAAKAEADEERALRTRAEAAKAEAEARAAKAEAPADEERALRTSAEARAAKADEESALRTGTFFSTIEELWAFKNISFQNHESFVRSHNVPDGDNLYEKTVEAAKKGDEKDDETYNSAEKFSAQEDIFGNRDPIADLLPYSSSCASYWFPIVPWVLCTGEEKLSWDFMQKCLHGSSKVTDVGLENGSEMSGETRLPNVGIIHFPTNRIQLVGQEFCFYTYPCVIIVPILSVENVRNWRGEGYDAIVLAGDWKPVDVNAPYVYRSIRAAGGMVVDQSFEKDLANEDQCNTACLLLKELILCVCHACHDYTHLHGNLQKDKNFDVWKSQLPRNTAPVPESKGWADRIKVRKISFSPWSEGNQNDVLYHPAPDPLLVLAKAASNWLRRHNMEILPVWGDNDST